MYKLVSEKEVEGDIKLAMEQSYTFPNGNPSWSHIMIDYNVNLPEEWDRSEYRHVVHICDDIAGRLLEEGCDNTHYLVKFSCKLKYLEDEDGCSYKEVEYYNFCYVDLFNFGSGF